MRINSDERIPQIVKINTQTYTKIMKNSNMMNTYQNNEIIHYEHK